MNAQPARDDYVVSPLPRIPFQSEAEVISLPSARSQARETPPPPEFKSGKPAQTVTPNSGPNSGTRITLRDAPGDWGSVLTVYYDSPESLAEQMRRVREGLARGDAAGRLAAGWAVLVLIPRAVLHLGSWLAADPYRAAGAACLLIVFIATL